MEDNLEPAEGLSSIPQGDIGDTPSWYLKQWIFVPLLLQCPLPLKLAWVSDVSLLTYLLILNKHAYAVCALFRCYHYWQILFGNLCDWFNDVLFLKQFQFCLKLLSVSKWHRPWSFDTKWLCYFCQCNGEALSDYGCHLAIKIYHEILLKQLTWISNTASDGSCFDDV